MEEGRLRAQAGSANTRTPNPSPPPTLPQNFATTKIRNPTFPPNSSKPLEECAERPSQMRAPEGIVFATVLALAIEVAVAVQVEEKGGFAPRAGIE